MAGALDFVQDTFFGGAEKKAARARQAGFTEGIEEIRRQDELNREEFAPFLERGNVAGERLLELIGLRGPEAEQTAIDNFTESPGQAFLREQQERAVLRNASATGGLRGGNVLQELQRQAFGRSATRLDNRTSLLQQIASGGQNTATNQANIGSNLATTIASLMAGRGDARGTGLTQQAAARRSGLAQIAGAFI